MHIEPWMVAAGGALAFFAARALLGAPRAPATIVAERIRAGAKIVDVRSPGEFGSGAFPGAVNIPLTALGSRLGEIPRDRPVVVYCASGSRSGFAVRMLRRAGYAEVVNGGGLRHMIQTARAS
jgi:phage shock protein E